MGALERSAESEEWSKVIPGALCGRSPRIIRVRSQLTLRLSLLHSTH